MRRLLLLAALLSGCGLFEPPIAPGARLLAIPRPSQADVVAGSALPGPHAVEIVVLPRPDAAAIDVEGYRLDFRADGNAPLPDLAVPATALPEPLHVEPGGLVTVRLPIVTRPVADYGATINGPGLNCLVTFTLRGGGELFTSLSIVYFSTRTSTADPSARSVSLRVGGR